MTDNEEHLRKIYEAMMSAFTPDAISKARRVAADPGSKRVSRMAANSVLKYSKLAQNWLDKHNGK